MQTSNPAAEIFAAALRQHQAGALREAEQAYKRVLALDPSHVDALHHLGVLAYQAGRNDIAVELIGRAISLNEWIPECHYNIGIAFGALGRFDEAAAASKKAIALKPDYAEAYLNLGNAEKAKNRLEAAKSNYQQALALKPGLAAAHFNLANVLSDEGKLDEAVPHYEEALALRPNYAEALTNLGSVLLALGRTDEAEARHRAAIALNPRLATAHGNLGDLFLKQKKYDEAIECYRKALAVDPNYAEVHNNLGAALLAQGRNDEALRHYEKAFALRPRLSEAFRNFGKTLIAKGEVGKAIELIRRMHDIEETAETRALLADTLGDPLAVSLASESRSYKESQTSTAEAGADRHILIRAISEGWGNPLGTGNSSLGLINASVALVERTNPAFVAGMSRAIQAWPSRLPAHEFLQPDELAEIAKDDLLCCLLKHERLNSIELEKFLSALRSMLLEMASRADSVSNETLSLFSALAQQCFNNEYIFSAPEEEWKTARLLRKNLEQAIALGKPPIPLQVAAVASYFALHELAGADTLLLAALPEALTPLLLQQILEPKEESEYRASMPCLTSIEDNVSRQVKEQYEQNPYPRWAKTMSRVSQRMKIDEYISRRFPHASFRKPPGKTECLAAGCGTGREVAVLKTFIDIDRMLAVDLSLASLAFAKRMAKKLGLESVEFAQADLLQLASLDRTFDLVDSTGVLHHLADPLRGWRTLVSILRPGGVMRIGLYSERARHMVVRAREKIAARGYGHSPDEIRRFRQEVIDMGEQATIRKVMNYGDFYSLSECRDFLFHVQEHRFTLPQIAQFLDENGLVFLGFDLPPEVIGQYAKRFPEDRTATNLDWWHQFEEENPDTFAHMYLFWVRKTATQEV